MKKKNYEYLGSFIGFLGAIATISLYIVGKIPSKEGYLFAIYIGLYIIAISFIVISHFLSNKKDKDYLTLSFAGILVIVMYFDVIK